MSFIGRIPAECLGVVTEAASGWAGTVMTLCSGGLTVPLSVRRHFEHDLKIVGNDVEIYPAALGYLAAGEPMRLEVREECDDWWMWLFDGAEKTEDFIAAMDFALTIWNTASPHTKYARRMGAYYRDDDYLAKRKARAKRVAEVYGGTLDGFRCMDAIEALEGFAGPVVTFPPFYKGGYERLFVHLNEMLVWDRPQYTIMGDEERADLLAAVRDREHWVYGVDDPRFGESKDLVGRVKPSSSAVDVLLYASDAVRKTLVMPGLTVAVDIATHDVRGWDDLSGPFELARVPREVLQAEIGRLMAWRVDSSVPLRRGLALHCGDRVIGYITFSRLKVKAGRVVMLADIAVPAGQEFRFAKLVAHAALTTDVQRVLEHDLRRPISSVCTVSYSKNPKPPKYRTRWWDVVNRAEQPDGTYIVGVSGKAGSFTIDELKGEWNKWTKNRATASAG